MSWLDTWRAFIGTVPPVQDTQTQGDGMIVLAPRPAQFASALPRNLKRLMAERRWNVVSLAIASGVSGSTIRGILTGTPPTSVADPLLSACLKLAQALEVYLDQLVEDM